MQDDSLNSVLGGASAGTLWAAANYFNRFPHNVYLPMIGGVVSGIDTTYSCHADALCPCIKGNAAEQCGGGSWGDHVTLTICVMLLCAVLDSIAVWVRKLQPAQGW